MDVLPRHVPGILVIQGHDPVKCIKRTGDHCGKILSSDAGACRGSAFHRRSSCLSDVLIRRHLNVRFLICVSFLNLGHANLKGRYMQVSGDLCNPSAISFCVCMPGKGVKKGYELGNIINHINLIYFLLHIQMLILFFCLLQVFFSCYVMEWNK